MVPKVLRGLVLLLPVIAGAACAGYRTDPLFPESIRRIAVPIFENDTFFRQIEFALTTNVTDVLRMRPGIHVVAEDEADVVLRGRITRVDQRVLSITRRDRASESSATTTVRCELIDRSTGEVVKAFTTSERVDFALATGEGLETAQREAFWELARKIVFELEADW